MTKSVYVYGVIILFSKENEATFVKYFVSQYSLMKCNQLNYFQVKRSSVSILPFIP